MAAQVHQSATHPLLLGRQQDLARVDDWWQSTAQALTIVGPGGVGKTTLAVVFARRHEWPIVDLAPCRTPHDMHTAIRAAVGCRDGKPAAPTLILDNAETVANSVRESVPSWSDSRVLITSRIVLGIPNEITLQLAPLSLADAVTLLRHRAPHQADYPSLDEDLKAIAESLDGLPLALELAAARLPVLGPRALRTRLVRDLSILKNRSSDDRHATLERTLRWSWDLLEPGAQRALACMSLFRDPFTVDAADSVIGRDALDHIETLNENSLLVAMPHQEGVARYRLLETVRAFATQRRLHRTDARALELAHADHFTSQAICDRPWGNLAIANDLMTVADRYKDERPPTRTVRAMYAHSDIAESHPLSPTLRRWLDERLGELQPPLRGLAHHARASYAFNEGALDIALADYTTIAHSPESPPRMQAAALGNRVSTLIRMGRLEEALPEAEALIAFSDRLEDPGEHPIQARYRVVVLRQATGDLAAARAVAIELVQQARETHLAGVALYALGFIDHRLGAVDLAAARFREGLQQSWRIPMLRHRCEGALAMALHELGDDESADLLYEQVVASLLDIDCTQDAAEFLAARALLHAELGSAEYAIGLLGRAEPMLIQSATGHWVARAYALAVNRALGRQAGVEAFEAARRETPEVDALEMWFPLRRIATWKRVDLQLAESGRWFRCSSEQAVDLSRRGAMRRILRALAVQHHTERGVALTRETVFEAGWPGERIAQDSAAHRVRVAISSLRKAGLQGMLVRNDDGYLLRADLRVEYSKSDVPPG